MTFDGGVGMSTTETEADGTKTETEQTNASVSMTYKIGQVSKSVAVSNMRTTIAKMTKPTGLWWVLA